MEEIDEWDWVATTEIEDKYRRPRKKVSLDPLISLPAIEYTPEQLKEVNGESKYGFMEVFETKLSYKTGKLNTLFSNDIPDWIDEKILFNFFRNLKKIPKKHLEKKTNKNFIIPLLKLNQKKN